MILRNLITISAFLCFFACKNQSNPSNATNGQSSTGMQEDFSKRYPNAQDIVWDTLESGFAALYLDGEFENKTYYDIKGVFQNTATYIEQRALPAAVLEVLAKKYQNAAAAVIMRVENGKNRTYQIELETSTDYINLEFDESGKLLKEEKHPLSNEEIQRQEEEGVNQNDK